MSLVKTICITCTAIEDLREIFQDVLEAAAYWFTVGVFLGMPYHTLQAIRNDYRDQGRECLREMLAAWLTGKGAFPAVMVQALRAAGMVVLARKMAVKHGKNRDKLKPFK